MARLLLYDPERDWGSLLIFISSPSKDPRGQPWDLRRRLSARLQEMKHRTWLWEDDAELERRAGPSDDTAIIIRALQRSDMVVVLFASRAGTFFPDQMSYGTDFEIRYATALRKPLRLYVLGDRPQPRLRTILEVLADPGILRGEAKRFETEQELEDAVVSDVTVYLRSLSYPRLQNLVPSFGNSSFVDEDWLHLRWTQMQSAITGSDYRLARGVAEQVPVISQPHLSWSRDATFAYARLLGLCANVWANQAEHALAKRCAKASVSLYMVLGYWYDMFAQIQALSGILNMGGEVERAFWVNTYGLRGLRAKAASPRYRSLIGAYNDSRGSILGRLGKEFASKERLGTILVSAGEPSPYNVAKFANALASLGRLDEAWTYMEEQALPEARATGRSVGYVLRHAAALALRSNEYELAGKHLAEGEAVCAKLGLQHTLHGIRQLTSCLRMIQ